METEDGIFPQDELNKNGFVFDQQEFLDANHTGTAVRDFGYIYIPEACQAKNAEANPDCSLLLLMLFPCVKLIKFLDKIRIIFFFQSDKIWIILLKLMQKVSMSEWWRTGGFSSFYIGADSRYRDTTEYLPRVLILRKNYHKILRILPKEME